MNEEVEIRVLLAQMQTTLKDVKEDVSEIKVQTKLTNGRVGGHDVALARIWGAVGILGFLLTVGVPLLAVFVH